jgi:hypothetical protein
MICFSCIEWYSRFGESPESKQKEFIRGVMATVDKREKEKRGRPRLGQGKTKDGHKDTRGRPREGERLRKTGTKKK